MRLHIGARCCPGSNYANPDWPEGDGTGGTAPSSICEDGLSIDCESEPGGNSGNQPQTNDSRCVDDSDDGGPHDMGTSDNDSDGSGNNAESQDSNCDHRDGESEEAQPTSTQLEDGTLPDLPTDIDVEEADGTEETTPEDD